jgi:hypothetical protein
MVLFTSRPVKNHLARFLLFYPGLVELGFIKQRGLAMRGTGNIDLKKKNWVAGCGSIRFAALLVVVVILSLLTACQLPDFGAFLKQPILQQPKEEGITTDAEQITLAWDAPPEAVSSYDVYCRSHGTSSWQVMGSVSAVPQPEYTVLHSTLGNGEYDFAVIAVNDQGDRSDYHTSLDPTAQPDTGWYLVWYR